jgi:hypothetical protein
MKTERISGRCVRAPFAFVAEVDEETKPEARRFQVVVDLGTVLVGQFGDGLDLHDDFAKAEEIRVVMLFQGTAFVGELEFGLRLIRNVSHPQFDLQTFLIHCLQKATPLVVVHLEARPNGGVRFVLVNKFRHVFFFS